MSIKSRISVPFVCISLAIVFTVIFVAFIFVRDIPSRMATGENGRIAIQILDQTRRPFLEIFGATSTLLEKGYSETTLAALGRGVDKGRHIIAEFRASAGYNPEALEIVERLSANYEKWVNDTRSLFDLVATTGKNHSETDDEGYHDLVSTTTREFHVTMDILGEAETPIHNDIDEGIAASNELIVLGGMVVAIVLILTFFLQSYKNKTLGKLLAEKEENILKRKLAEDEQAQLEQRVIERTKEITLVHEITIASNEASSAEAAMEACLDQICAFMGWEIGHVYIPDSNGVCLPADIWHLDDPDLFRTFVDVTRKITFAPGIGLPGRVFKSGEPAWIMDLKADTNFLRTEMASDIGVKSGFAFPVLEGKNVAAVLEFYTAETKEPDESLLESVKLLAVSLGRVTERKKAEENTLGRKRAEDEQAQLEQRVKERTKEIKLVQEITIASNEAPSADAAMRTCLEQICSFMGWEIGHVYIPDSNGVCIPTDIWHVYNPHLFETFVDVTSRTTFAPGLGLPGRVFQTGEPAWIIDLKKDANFLRTEMAPDIGVNSGFAFPVLEGKKVAAVLEFYTVETKEPDESLLESVKLLAVSLGRATERKRAEEEQTERMLHAEFRAEIGLALTESGDLREILQRCCASMVKSLDAAFARVWIFNDKDNMLELEASAGLYTHIDGGHSRIPLGKFKIGAIAKERKSHFTNAVIGDPRVSEQEWAKREGMVAFAGYPLVVDDELVGVMAMFARKRLTETAMQMLGSVANEIALGIEHKRTEEELAQFKTTLDKTLDCVFMFAPDTFKFFYANKGAIDQVGYSHDELLDMTPVDLKPGVTEDEFLQMVSPLLRGEQALLTFEAEHEHKNGALIPVEISLQYISPSGESGRFVAIVRDITERKRAEEKRDQLEEQIRHKQKLESMGVLAGGVAHDFNNMLSAVIGNVQMTLEDLNGNDEARENLQEALTASHRCKDLVRQILAFSRKGEQDLQPINPCDIISEAVKFIRSALPATIKIKENMKGFSGTALADPTQLNQVVSNLCINAGQAMEETGGVLSINVKTIDIDEDSTPGRLNAGRHMLLTVSDTGPGMDKETVERIFDPFFTTKEIGKGTGLGLSVVHGIVVSHNGAINVRSEPGEGTVFEVYLPLVDAPPLRIYKTLQSVPTGNERVLLVDDEAMLVGMTKAVLKRLGYEVTGFTSSTRALEEFSSAPEKFDLVITDLTMPELAGDKLSKKLLEIRGDIPIIMCTGFSHSITAEAAKEIGIREFLMKPVIATDLAEAVRRALDMSVKSVSKI